MKKIYYYYLFIFVFLSDFSLFAQPTDEDGDGDPEGNDGAPIDSKLIILMFIGLFFVFYTYRKNKNSVE